MSQPTFRECYFDTVLPKVAHNHDHDIRYFWAWARIELGVKKQRYPIPLPWLLKFVDGHLKGRSATLLKQLKRLGFESLVPDPQVRTILGWVSRISVEHTLREVTNTCLHPTLRLLLHRLRKQVATQKRTQLPITREILFKLLAACPKDLRGTRDRAILLVGFAGGGRRCQELVTLSVEHLEPVKNGYIATLPSHKTRAVTHEPLVFPIFDEAARAMDEWLHAAKIQDGRVFRGIGLDGSIRDHLNPHLLWNMMRRLTRRAGLDPTRYGTRSIRSGFVTQAAMDGFPPLSVMSVSGHRSINSFLLYYRDGQIFSNPASHLANLSLPK